MGGRCATEKLEPFKLHELAQRTDARNRVDNRYGAAMGALRETKEALESLRQELTAPLGWSHELQVWSAALSQTYYRQALTNIMPTARMII